MNVLPNKYVPLDYSILGVAAIVVREMQPNDTVSTLWDRLASNKKVRTFERFAAALTLLFATQSLELNSGILRLIPARTEEK